ncbi:3-hydroxyisobutyrate dehydrogenase [Nonomuraea sp. 10N515B]|uniref:3-hydroxyisobutyrate dehydrogenase n=1 Tax=Nonomuraea sp. 10N515B TaxID=3457422 RepID=UPI003FCE19DD
MTVVAWIGLGHMGCPMAAHLVKAGFTVRGVEIDPTAREAASAAGVEVAGSVAEAVADADAVFTMLPTGLEVRAVLTGEEGVLAHIRPGTLVIDSSTIDIATARELHETAAAAGARFADAPVSGGVEGAKAGTLTFMVGCSPEVVAAARSLIEPMAGRIVPTGGPGTGQAAKIVNNMILGVSLAATCEGVVLAERLGLDLKTFYEIATQSSADNWALRTWYPAPGVVESAPSSRDYTPGFSTNLMVKDLALALLAGESTHTPLSAAAAAHRLFSDSAADGAGDRDCSALVLAVAGASVAHDPKDKP